MDANTARQINLVRSEQTGAELELLDAELTAWLKRRRESDQSLGKHRTQLRALETLLRGALTALGARVAAIDPGWSTGKVYDNCRQADEAVVWLRRIWEFFREKFDQRDDERTRDLLRAADEIVWSCYYQVIRRAQLKDASIPRLPAPLPYLAPEYSPAALQSDRPLPPGLHLSNDTSFMREYAAALPIPLLRLPPWCVNAPWWLVYIGHEVGHHIYSDLTLATHLREGLRGLAAGRGLPEESVDAWGIWSEEIFADVFSAVVMGPWALWAISELEWSAPERMVKRKPRYPAPVVRLALLKATLARLGLEPGPALRGIDLEAIAATDAVAEGDMELADDVVAFCLGPLRPPLPSLRDLCLFKPESFMRPNGTVERWAKALRQASEPVAKKSLETAREVASGALCAWADIAAERDAAARASQQRDLAQRATRLLIRSAAEGTRAMGPDQNLTQQGQQLADRLFDQLA
jgi:hypothetical protein